jgi:hypothetical protein
MSREKKARKNFNNREYYRNFAGFRTGDINFRMENESLRLN